jgi:hypothetical protein
VQLTNVPHSVPQVEGSFVDCITTQQQIMPGANRDVDATLCDTPSALTCNIVAAS